MGALKSKFRRSKSRSDKPNEEKARKPSKQKKAVNLPESQSARKIVDSRLPFSNYRQIFSIRNAWKAIQRAMEECAKETFISLLNKHPRYREVFTDVKDLKDGDLDVLRFNEDFEQKAMCMYNIFDDVITNLEEVNKALRTIEYDAEPTEFTAKMIKAYHDPFIETIRQHLGYDRFTEATENNFKLLYQFVQDEMCKFVRDDTAEPDIPDVEEVINNEATESDIPGNTDADADVHVEAEADAGIDTIAGVENDAGEENNEGVEREDKDNDTTTGDADKEIVVDSQIEVSLCEDNAT